MEIQSNVDLREVSRRLNREIGIFITKIRRLHQLLLQNKQDVLMQACGYRNRLMKFIFFNKVQ